MQDEGGVTKEFFQILVHDLFNENYGMFVYRPQTRTFWFNMLAQGMESEFELVGIVIGLAIYNGVILDVHFPLVVYKKLLNQELTLAVSPLAAHGSTAIVDVLASISITQLLLKRPPRVHLPLHPCSPTCPCS